MVYRVNKIVFVPESSRAIFFLAIVAIIGVELKIVVICESRELIAG